MTFRTLFLVTVMLFVHYPRMAAQEARTDSVPDGIFFRIGGGGLTEPSYMLGTLHTVPGDYVNHIPQFAEAAANVRQFIFESDVAQKMRQTVLTAQYDSTTEAFLKTRNDSLYRYDHPDSLHNPYLEDLEGMNLYDLIRSTMEDTFGLADFYKYSAWDNVQHLNKRYHELIKELVAKLGYPLQLTQYPIDLYIADSIARPREVDILSLDTMQVLENLDSILVQFLVDEKAGKHDRKYYSTTFLPNSVFYHWLLLFTTRRYCAAYFRHEGHECIEKSNDQIEQKIFAERNALWMQRLPAMLHRAPSMVVVGLGHLFDRPSTSGLLSSLMSLGYTVEAIAAPSTPHKPQHK